MKIENKDNSEIIIEKILHYLNKFTIGYKFVSSKEEIYNGKTAYLNYAYFFHYSEKYLLIRLDVAKYITNSITFFFYIEKYNSLLEYQANINLSEYFRQYKKTDYRDHFILSDYPGNTFEEKLDQFFAWLTSVTDEKLVKIFKGEDWVDVPYDWGDEK